MPNTPGCSPGAPGRGRKALPSLPMPSATLCSQGTVQGHPSPLSPSFPPPGRPAVRHIAVALASLLCNAGHLSQPALCWPHTHTHTHTHTHSYVQPWPLAQAQQALSPDEAPRT